MFIQIMGIFLIIFYSIFSLIAICSVFNVNIKNTLKNWDIDLGDIAIILFFMILITIIMAPITEKNLLECDKCKNGKLAYVDTINYDNGTTFYRYHCDNCDRLFRTEKWRGK